MIENWVFIQSEPGLWTVGFYGPDKWTPESDHDNQEAAAKRVNYLNGSIAQPPHPELGSGALREALTKLSNEAGGMLGLSGVREAIGNTNMACLQLRVDEARALLSLSSPTEPPPCLDCEAAAKHAHSDATTPGFFHSTCAKHRPTPQASSEIRERLAAIPGDVDTLLSRIIYGESVEDVRRKVAGYLERALAPSRQGAAKRV